jgi:hypothetical protein
MIPALARLRKENYEFKASLSNIARLPIFINTSSMTYNIHIYHENHRKNIKIPINRQKASQVSH